MEQTSPEEYDEHGSDIASGDDDTEVKAEHTSPQSAHTGDSKSNGTSKQSSHLQKRRRVTRACDECRRKKIKCDGKQPCTHCTVYSYDCTYDQPSNRRRNPAPQYVENLEHRVHRAETLLHILIPNLDLNNPGIDAAVAQGWIPGAPGKGRPSILQDAIARPPSAPPVMDPKIDMNLESMIRAVAQIDLDETGHWDYHGHSSGLSFVRRMREQLGDMMGPEGRSTPFVKAPPVEQILDSPKSGAESPMVDGLGQHSDLPPRDLAKRICGYAVNDAASLLKVVHAPTFWNSFERIFSLSPDRYTNEDHVFLPLLYSTMALGSLFGKSTDDREGYETSRAQGLAYFKAARHMMDIADCRDLPHIQAVVFMILFLQSTAKLSQCYAYLGIALRSACRMGLHRSASIFNPVEAETRKRLFWTIRNLDAYVGAMIGLPNTIRDEDIDQDFPVEVDDEYITAEGILPMPEGQVSLMVAFNLHTKLVDILMKIVRKVYPIKFQTPLGMGDKAYSVPFSSIREIESDLEQWKTSLPAILTPSEVVGRYTRVQQLLRLSYAWAQVMLYRPFLHFVTVEKREKLTDQRPYACAASFVNVSRNIIHIQTHMKQKGLLNGGYWFSMYTTFFSIMGLVYFAAENPDNPTTHAVMKDAIEGREVLASLASHSMAADRCTATLNGVFNCLPAWMREGQPNPVLTKKRPYFAGNESVNQTSNVQVPRSQPEVANQSQEPAAQIRRAATFPNPAGVGQPIQSAMSATSPYNTSWSQAGSTYGTPHTPTSATFESNNFGSLSQNGLPNANQGTFQFANSQNFGNPALTDLSTMMFGVGNEPFVYPNQPLTTFENNQQFGKGDAFAANATGNMFNNVGSVSPSSSNQRNEEDIEAQYYALPPSIQRGPNQQPMIPQQQFPLSGNTFGQPDRPPYLGRQSVLGTQGMHVPDGRWNNVQDLQQQQQDMSGFNIPDLFGNEWSNMMTPANGFQNPIG